MQELQRMIRQPFVPPEFSTVELRGDQLIVTVIEATRSPWPTRVFVLLVILSVALGSSLFGASSDSIIGILTVSGSLFFSIEYALKTKKKGRHQLRISRRGVSLLSLKRGASSGGKTEAVFPIEVIEGYHLEQGIQHRPYSETNASSGGKILVPGIYFRQKGGTLSGFALNDQAVGGPVLGPYSQRDFAELKWLFSIIESHLLALGAAASETPGRISAARSANLLRARAILLDLLKRSALPAPPRISRLSDNMALPDTEGW